MADLARCPAVPLPKTGVAGAVIPVIKPLQ